MGVFHSLIFNFSDNACWRSLKLSFRGGSFFKLDEAKSNKAIQSSMVFIENSHDSNREGSSDEELRKTLENAAPLVFSKHMSPLVIANFGLVLCDAILQLEFVQKVSPPEPLVLKQMLSNESSLGVMKILYLFPARVEISRGRGGVCL